MNNIYCTLENVEELLGMKSPCDNIAMFSILYCLKSSLCSFISIESILKVLINVTVRYIIL